MTSTTSTRKNDGLDHLTAAIEARADKVIAALGKTAHPDQLFAGMWRGFDGGYDYEMFQAMEGRIADVLASRVYG